ncbi:MAG TPA: MFS transporter [Desulfomonilia bacterium]|nr:MFS transporter [Desulfomonilia bacterium]
MRKSIYAWAMYDWANSAFATTVMAGFFPIMFKEFWNAGVDSAVSTARLGLTNSLAGAFVALSAPVLGAIADRSAGKKRFLGSFAFVGIAATISLAFVPKGYWLLASLFYSLGLVGFLGGNVFYDSLLKTVAEEPAMDRVSTLGYALGYLGGGLLFGLNVAMTLKPGLFGLADAAQAAAMSFFSVGIWWAVFSLPIMTVVREHHTPAGDFYTIIHRGLSQLMGTFREVRHLKTICLFLMAYWLYIDGVDTIIVMAVDYGLSLGFRQQDLILALLLVQFVGFPFAISFGHIAGFLGTKRSILLGMSVYLFVSVWGAFITTRIEFYIMAVLIGMVQGGVQALSRSLYAALIPEDKAAQYFGFYNLLGKFATIVGPVLIGSTVLAARYFGASPNLAPRISISSVSLLFIAGGVLLMFVDEEKGKQESSYL